MYALSFVIWQASYAAMLALKALARHMQRERQICEAQRVA